MSINKKLVSVIMPTYNAEKYIREAIESIKNQTYENWELIVIDDKSIDSTQQIVNEYIKGDSRIKLIEGKKHGVGGALNLGIEIANGDYIARMDADDISLPERLEKQVGFMEKHNDVGVCATQFQIFSFNKVQTKCICELFTDQDIKAGMIITNVLGHSTIMFQKEIFQNGWSYTENIIAEDYDLWTRMIPDIKFECMKDVLLYYRQENQNLSLIINYEKKKTNDIRIIKTYITRVFKMDLSDYCDVDFGLHYYQVRCMYMYLIRQLELLHQIDVQNQELKVLSIQALRKTIQRRWKSLLDFIMIPDNILKINDALFLKNLSFMFDERRTLQEYKSKLDEMHEYIIGYVKTFKKIVLYGMGNEGEELFKIFLSLQKQQISNWSLEALIDRNRKEVIVNSKQYVVYEPQYLKELKPDLILICTNRHYDAIKKGLIDKKIYFKQILSGNILRFFYEE